MAKLGDNQKSALNITACIVLVAINTCINFFLSPFIVKHLGAEANGYITLANNFVSYFGLIITALNSMAGRFILIEIRRDNLKEANEYYSSVLFGDWILASILLIPCLILVFKLERFINIPKGKRLAECLCMSYASQYRVPVKVARLAQTFGAGVLPGENRVFAQFLRSALKGEDIVLHTKGQSVGNYCYTADAIEAILLLLVMGENGEAYTVVNEETTTAIADMADLVARYFSNGKSKVVFDIPQNNSFGYAPDTKMRLSSQKLRNLGWTPRVSLFEAYKRMISDLK